MYILLNFYFSNNYSLFKIHISHFMQNTLIDNDQLGNSSTSPSSSNPYINTSNVKVNRFLRVLLEILNTPLYTRIISWDDDGESFTIHNPVLFKENVLLTYFKYNNLSNFIRQLNIYSFNKTRKERITYANPFFHRDDMSKIGLIERKKVSLRRERKERFFKKNEEFIVNNESCLTKSSIEEREGKGKEGKGKENEEKRKENERNHEEYVNFLEFFIWFTLIDNEKIQNNIFESQLKNQENFYYSNALFSSLSTNLIEKIRLLSNKNHTFTKESFTIHNDCHDLENKINSKSKSNHRHCHPHLHRKERSKILTKIKKNQDSPSQIEEENSQISKNNSNNIINNCMNNLDYKKNLCESFSLFHPFDSLINEEEASNHYKIIIEKEFFNDYFNNLND